MDLRLLIDFYATQFDVLQVWCIKEVKKRRYDIIDLSVSVASTINSMLFLNDFVTNDSYPEECHWMS